MKIKFLLLTSCLLSSIFLYSQAQRKADNETEEWRYEIEGTTDVSQQGVEIVKIWTYSKKEKVALMQAPKNAVHAILFKGYVHVLTTRGTVKPLIEDPNAWEKHQAFWEEFFADGGAFQRFVTVSQNFAPSKVKINKEFKVGVKVSIMRDQLRSYLEESGILEKLSDKFGGKMPSIMVVPSDSWCANNNFMSTYDIEGITKSIPDYKSALQNHQDLKIAISKIGEKMAERGYPLKDLEQSLKSIENQEAEDEMLTSKYGDAVAESPIDKLKKTAKADIIIQLDWKVNTLGPKKSLTFNLQGLDTYTDKQVAAASGTGSQTYTDDVAILIPEAVEGHMDQFNSQLVRHFEDIAEKGREISIRIKVWDSFEDGLEYDCGGMELGEVIEEWLDENCQGGAYNTSDVTENMMFVQSARIPLQEVKSNGKRKDLDARQWLRGLQKHLMNDYDIEAKLMMRGLGQAQLVIGGK